MMLQAVPPTPPALPFDPHLFMNQDWGPPFVLIIVVAALASTVVLLGPFVRAFARRLEGKGSGDSALRGEVEQLHARVSEVDMLQSRLAELEERVDFAERLLAQAHEPQSRVLRGETP
jgi:Tfp pilus assembly protein PilO